MIKIDIDTRCWKIPKEECFLGVESDDKVRILQFELSKNEFCDGLNFTDCNCFINYKNEGNDTIPYVITDMELQEDGTVTFTWEVSRGATIFKGNTFAILCAKKVSDDGTITNEWNSRIGSFTVAKGIEPLSSINEVPEIDIISQLLLVAQETNTNAQNNIEQSNTLLEKAEGLAYLKDDFDVLEARMNQFTSLQEGSTTGDAELIDGRIGYDGKVYDNIGGAIREQISELKGDLDTLNQGGLNLKEDFIGTQVNNWLDEHPEATTTVQNGSLDELKFTDEAKTKIVKEYVTPEMFGAVGDGVTDDTNAVQECLNNSNKFKILVGNYKITNSIIITGNDIKVLGTNSRINYNGTDSAIIISSLNDSVLELGLIYSQGNGIEIKSTSDNEWSQYTDIHFRLIDCVEKAIYFNTTAGWTNEIRIYDGKINRGKFGIHADAHNRNVINNITIQNVGIEGVKTGFYLANNINSWNIVNPRYHESYETLFETVGRVSKVNFFGTGMFYYNSACKFSGYTQMSIHAPLTKDGGSILDQFGGRIVNGCVVFNSHREYINSFNSENVIIGPEQCVNYILSGINLKSIKLNASYGTNYGVSEFYVNNASDNIISIYKKDGTVITSNLAAWSKYKFTYINSLGWVYEKLSMTETHVN